jgi:hypothetical protein
MRDYKTPCKHIRLYFEHASFEQGTTHARWLAQFLASCRRGITNITEPAPDKCSIAR